VPRSGTSKGVSGNDGLGDQAKRDQRTTKKKEEGGVSGCELANVKGKDKGQRVGIFADAWATLINFDQTWELIICKPNFLGVGESAG